MFHSLAQFKPVDFQSPKLSDSQVKSECANLHFQDVHVAQPQLSDTQVQYKPLAFQDRPMDFNSNTVRQDISDFPALLKTTNPKVEKQVFSFNLQAMRELSRSTVETLPVCSAAKSLPVSSYKDSASLFY